MPYVYPQQAAAGLYTTPTDLAKFFIDVQKSYIGKGKILSQSAVKQMLTPQQTVSDGTYKEQIGIGPFLIQRSDNQEVAGTYFEFTGINAGFLAYGIASITNGNEVVNMLNSGDDVNGVGKELRRAVAKVYEWTNFLPDELIPVDLTDNELNKFKSTSYRVIIKTSFCKSFMRIAIANIIGNNKKEILFSSYICHPAMANNELSGPILMAMLINFIKKKKTLFSYKFVLYPETIGPIFFINKFRLHCSILF
jgi:hypothetical protein